MAITGKSFHQAEARGTWRSTVNFNKAVWSVTQQNQMELGKKE